MVKSKPERKKELLPGTLEMLILKSLDRNTEPMHGYGIALYIKQISRDVLRVEEGSLYPALQRLAIKGLIAGEWRDSDTGRRARYYKLTSAGKKQLAEELESALRKEPSHALSPARAELLWAIHEHGLKAGRYEVRHPWKHTSISGQPWFCQGGFTGLAISGRPLPAKPCSIIFTDGCPVCHRAAFRSSMLAMLPKE